MQLLFLVLAPQSSFWCWFLSHHYSAALVVGLLGWCYCFLGVLVVGLYFPVSLSVNVGAVLAAHHLLCIIVVDLDILIALSGIASGDGVGLNVRVVDFPVVVDFSFVVGRCLA